MAIYDVAIWRSRFNGGAQFPEYIDLIRADSPLAAVTTLMGRHRLTSIYRAAAAEVGTTAIERFDGLDLKVTYDYEQEVY
jgi:hypothetical protein